jgi:hypothetical protein
MAEPAVADARRLQFYGIISGIFDGKEGEE